MAEFPQKVLAIGNKKYCYYDVGSGDHAVIFLHGLAEDKEWALYQVDLDAIGGRQIMLDLPGHGEVPMGAISTLEGFAEYIRDFVEGIGLRCFYLVGFSLGGMIALKFAELYGERFELEGVCAWSSPVTGFEHGITARGKLYFRLIEIIPDFLFRLFTRPSLQKIVTFLAGMKFNDYHLNVYSRTQKDDYVRSIRALRSGKVALGHSKREIVIFGNNDTWVAQACYSKMAELNKDRVECAMIDNCGHYGTSEGREAASKKIAEFVNKV